MPGQSLLYGPSTTLTTQNRSSSRTSSHCVCFIWRALLCHYCWRAFPQRQVGVDVSAISAADRPVFWSLLCTADQVGQTGWSTRSSAVGESHLLFIAVHDPRLLHVAPTYGYASAGISKRAGRDPEQNSSPNHSQIQGG